MEIKVGDVFKFKGTDEGVFAMGDDDFPSARLRVTCKLERGRYRFMLKTNTVPEGFTQYANTEEIAEVLEKAVAFKENQVYELTTSDYLKHCFFGIEKGDRLRCVSAVHDVYGMFEIVACAADPTLVGVRQYALLTDLDENLKEVE
jgi:hypothetical protein